MQRQKTALFSNSVQLNSAAKVRSPFILLEKRVAGAESGVLGGRSEQAARRLVQFQNQSNVTSRRIAAAALNGDYEAPGPLEPTRVNMAR
jgi:hypothetical protein